MRRGCGERRLPPLSDGGHVKNKVCNTGTAGRRVMLRFALFGARAPCDREMLRGSVVPGTL